MTHTVLLEIGLEELPANVIQNSIQQLKKRTEQFLTDNRLQHGEVKVYSTPRRLTVQVFEVAEKQADQSESVKGPSKKIAVAEDGTWSKAAQGFVRGQGMTVEDIVFKDVKGTDYVFVEKFTEGLPAKEILKELKHVVTSMNFPISMNWNSYTFRYIRPIHWLVALLDDEVIPFQVLDVKTGSKARGHRFLGQEVQIPSAEQYEEAMEKEFVIADREKRQQMIMDQIHTLTEEQGWRVEPDQELLDEVTDMVEYPTAYYGTFDKEFLTLPSEVLITSMKDHQRYFAVKSESGEILPVFLFVRNGNKEHIENVAKGNEKVLSARLQDAVFFYEEDKKLSIDECLDKLKKVTFHDKLGSLSEKTERVEVIAAALGQMIGLSDEELVLLQRAAAISKFDLVTNMVNEFPKLQGIMGEKYALLQGEEPLAAQGVREHYQPVSSEGKLPDSDIGAVLSIADKLDSVMMFFAAGMIPSGSNDPYALRRQAYGILRIVLANQWAFPVRTVLEQLKTVIPYPNNDIRMGLEENLLEIQSFLKERIRQVLQSKDIRHDVTEAILDSKQDDLRLLVDSAEVLQTHHSDESFKGIIESLTRVTNLAEKAAEEWDSEPIIIENLFKSDSEKELYEASLRTRSVYQETTDAEQRYQALADLHPVIDTFFDENMVMTDEEAVRKNRLALLASISQFILQFAEMDHLVVK